MCSSNFHCHPMNVCLLILTVMYFGAWCIEHPNVTVILSEKDQTWSEAVNDASCSLLGLNHTGDITQERNKIHIYYNRTPNTFLAWLGAHTERIWINFEGCRVGTIHHARMGVNISNDKNPIHSCLNQCNFGNFVLTQSKCFCNDEVNVSSNGCRAARCPMNETFLCGSAIDCMCAYSKYNGRKPIRGTGDCMTITYKYGLNKGPIYRTSNCSFNHAGLCYDPSHSLLPIVYRNQSTWSTSIQMCFDQNKQFAGMQNFTYNPGIGTYWVGVFAVTFMKWGIGNNNDFEKGCLAISKSNGSSALLSIPCSSIIRSLCVYFGKETQTTQLTSKKMSTSYSTTSALHAWTTLIRPACKHTTLLGDNTSLLAIKTTPHYSRIISTYKATQFSVQVPTNTLNITAASSQVSTESVKPYTINYTESKAQKENHQIFVIVGSITGTIVFVVIVTGTLLYCRRQRLHKKQDRGGLNPQLDGISTDIEVRYTRDSGNNFKEDNYLAGVYNELHENRNKLTTTNGDMYDHTFLEESRDTYNHLNTGKREHGRSNDNVYDHAFMGESSGAYGNVDKTNKEDRSRFQHEYDHAYVTNEHHVQSTTEFEVNTDGSENDQKHSETYSHYSQLNGETGNVYDDVKEKFHETDFNIHHVYAQVIKKKKT